MYTLVNDTFVPYIAGQYFFPTPTCPTGERFLAPGECQPDTPVPEKNNGTPDDCNAAKGNPCNAATGNKFQAETDSNADGLAVTRYYNSQFIQDIGWGFGWNTSVGSKRLTVNGFNVQVWRRDAKGETFTCGATCIGDPDTQLKLVDNRPGFTLTLHDGTSEIYDATGKLLTETSPTGRNTTYGYGGNGLVSTITGPFGHILSFGYNAYGHLETVTDPDQKTITYGYDANNNLTRVDYPDSTAKIYHYENISFPHHLTGISYFDSSGVQTRYSTYAYDATGKAIRTEHAQTDNGSAQEQFLLNYDSTTQTTVTDPVGAFEVMTFQTNLGVKNLTGKQLYNSSGVIVDAALQKIFDARNNLTCRKDEENRVTTYIYDDITNQRTRMTEGLLGDCTNPVDVPGVTRITNYEYLSPTLDLPRFIRRPSVATDQTFETEMVYGDAGHPNLPTQIIQRGYTPAGASVSRAVTLGYNAFGQVNVINGPRAPSDSGMNGLDDVTTLEYHECTTGGACGQLKQATNALGHVTTYDLYDANGRLLQMTDPNGLRTNYTYDPRGRVKTIRQTPASGPYAETQYSYTPWGDVSRVIDPDGVVLNYQYDAAQDLRFIVDAAGNYIHYKYDLKGNRTGEDIYDAGGNLKRTMGYAYDLRNHLSQINNAGNITQLINDAVGNLLSESPNSDGVNRTQTHQYDALNRLFETADAVNGPGAPTRYSHDTNGHPVLVTAPNNLATAYFVDDLGNRRRETSPDRGSTRYTHDAAGNVLTVINALGQTTTYVYDALNRLISRQSDDPATPRYTFEYDACGLGRLCTLRENGYLHMMYGYDGLGRTTSQLDANFLSVGYGYTPAGRLQRLTYPGGRTVDYLYNKSGRVRQVSTTANGTTTVLANQISHHPFGPVSSLTYGNGLQRSVLLDAAYRNYLRTDGPFLEFTTAYDAADNPKARAFANGNQTFAYDPLGRLTGATDTASGSFGSLGYGYDANGNRGSETRHGTVTGYTYIPAGSNWLGGVGSEIRVRDAAGNTSYLSGLGNLGYDGYGRLTAAGGAGSYAYNALDQRARKTVGANTTLFLYGPSGELLYENEDGTARAYVYLEGVPLARIAGNAVLYYHTDHLGTPQAMTNINRTGVWTAGYEPFGRATVNEDPDGNGVLVKNNMRYAGQYFDAETGLHYNWNRYYDPKVGRYITSDPIGLAGGLNTYSYVFNNPLRWIDPMGLAANPPICSGPDCIDPPYDPTPSGPKPSPQPGKPPSDPRNPGGRGVDPGECAKTMPTCGSCIACCNSNSKIRWARAQNMCVIECGARIPSYPDSCGGFTPASLPGSSCMAKQ